MANAADWFEIPVRDLARAVKFYSQVFGIEMHEMEMGSSRMAMFPMERGAAGAGGALVKDDGYNPSKDGSLVYLAAPDIDAMLDKVAKAGGRVLLPKMHIGEHGNIAHFEDSEGNRVALHSD
jgi:predicted enzyme related to lactoylglutathione lyase